MGCSWVVICKMLPQRGHVRNPFLSSSARALHLRFLGNVPDLGIIYMG